MKQILQNLGNGETILADVPCPHNKVGHLLIASSQTLVSAGTERMLVDFGKANFIEKARQQPDKVKMVLNKVRTDGIMPTLEAVRSKLDQPLPLGYCNAGIVLDSRVPGYEIGDRVVSNGHHAEVVRVPQNLCAKIPDNVDDESAAFTVLASIGLQGVRLAQPTLGECVVVTGLGLIGLLTVQLLRAHGCRVLGIDFDSRRCELACNFGAETVDLSKGENPIEIAASFSRGRGVDAVIITAATKSNEPVHQAAQMCRKRGRIVLVGVVGLELSRADFYEKELSFQVSCSYGPGRYDPEYENKGHDYPVGFVRWTEQRNFEAVLDMMSTGALNVKPLITHRYMLEEAIEAYQTLSNPSALGILLSYPNSNESKVDLRRKITLNAKEEYLPSDVVCAFLGAGNYASRVLIPGFKAGGAKLHTLASSGGVSGVHHGKKLGFTYTVTDETEIYNDSESNTVVIATQHNLHAKQALLALNAGKHVFVEKPLALTLEELDELEAAYEQTAGKQHLMIGFNRRFAPLVQLMKKLLSSTQQPKSFIMTMNAGAIPAEHWTQDPNVGGGRILGEACHYIDLMRFLAGSEITDFNATKMGDVPGVEVSEDKASITLTFADGSFGTIMYLANGGKSFPKERIEVFSNDAVLQLDNFKALRSYGWPGFKGKKLLSQDKGQNACAAAFIQAIQQGKPTPILADEIFEVSRVSVKVAQSLKGQL
ncbi:Predicted dehydrogenase [Pseudidiomarina indica]|uniref:Predicted dehydrogenase n=1 Tax=Pseudidiomarina indica TaxID=1159017 RepID=A0A1G6AUN3_9GAMM|nr:bi-domain-containing oxidoreductase [Pseudidiomarina indica]SDB12098.1 Predicted dehydrogenase [Pseudidiomarina indica]